MKNLKFNYLNNLIFKKSFISMSFILALFNCAAFGSESDFTVINPPFMFTTFNHKLNVGNLSTKEITLDKVSRKKNVVYASGANKNDEINGYTLNVELSDIATSSDNYVVNLIGGMSENSDASYNNINITKMPSTITRDIRIFGADSCEGNTNFNEVNIDSISTNISKLTIVGGRTINQNKGNSSNNTINISSSKLISDNTNVDFQITGGIAQKAQNNKVIIDNSYIINTILISGGASLHVGPNRIGTEKNIVKITSSNVKGTIIGGDSWLFDFGSDANKNEVEIISSKISKQDGSFIDFAIAGGASTNNATNNTVSITSSIINGDSYGGLSTTAYTFGGGKILGNANNNAINVTSSNIAGGIYGGSSADKNANENKVLLKISSVGSSVAGGSAKYEANNNIVNITSSDIGGDVYGGYSNEGDAIKNTINLFHNSGRDITTLGNYFLVKGVIHGGFSDGVNKDATSDNTLNVNGKNLIAGNIKNFNEVNFNLPKGLKTNDVVLQLTNDEDTVLNSVKVNPYVEQGESKAIVKNLKPKEKIYIIKKASIDENTLEEKQAIDENLEIKSKELTKATKSIVSEVGASTIYNVKLNKDESNLYLEVGEIESTTPTPTPTPTPKPNKPITPKVNPKINHTLIPNLASSHVVNQMSDLMGDNISNIAMLDDNISVNTDNIISFGYIKGYKSNIDKSDTDINGVVVDVGVASRADNVLMGGFFEYSYADYDGSANSYSSDGKINAYAVGALARFDLRNNFFIDSYAKIGKLNNKYTLKGYDNLNINKDSTFYSLGAFLGHDSYFDRFMLTNRLGYAYSNVDGYDLDINDETLNIKNISSKRIKFDSIAYYQVNTDTNVYARARFVYEFDCEGSIYAPNINKTAESKNNGFSGGGELGVIYSIKPLSNISFGVGAMGGKIDELSANVRFVYGW